LLLIIQVQNTNKKISKIIIMCRKAWKLFPAFQIQLLLIIQVQNTNKKISKIIIMCSKAW
jgi:hypothetical protein